MRQFLDFALLALGFAASLISAQGEAPEPVEDPSKSPALAVSVTATFPDAEIFGIKLVNGKPTRAVLSITNEETEEITVNFAGGSLWTSDYDPQGSRLIRNLTGVRYGVNVPAGEQQSLPYSFTTEMHPQDLRLNIAAVVSDSKGVFYTVQAYNGTVAIVEQDVGFFDLQMIFLYLFLLACTGGVFYFAYNTLVLPYFPQLQKKSRSGDRSKKPPKKVEGVPGAAVPGTDGPATATGAKAYDESWIPAHHLQRPEAKRGKSGTTKAKSKA